MLNSAVSPKKAHGDGRSQHPLYSIWWGMITRCHTPSVYKYPRYAGRGITVCDRWRNDFWAFVSDMGERHPGKSIDRINNDGNYEPGNCRWATKEQQAANKAPRPSVQLGPRVYETGEDLTPGEERVLHSMVQAAGYAEIAAQLGLSTRTIETHAFRIMKKSGCRSHFQLGVWYAKNFPDGEGQP